MLRQFYSNVKNEKKSVSKQWHNSPEHEIRTKFRNDVYVKFTYLRKFTLSNKISKEFRVLRNPLGKSNLLKYATVFWTN